MNQGHVTGERVTSSGHVVQASALLESRVIVLSELQENEDPDKE